MKVVRLIHPDKISGYLRTVCCVLLAYYQLNYFHCSHVAPTSNEERFVAEAAFVVLTEAYQKYAEDVVK